MHNYLSGKYCDNQLVCTIVIVQHTMTNTRLRVNWPKVASLGKLECGWNPESRFQKKYFVHSYKYWWTNIMTRISGANIMTKGTQSVWIEQKWLLAPAKEECGRNPDSWRSMFLLLATTPTHPRHPLTPLLSSGEGVDKGSIARQQILAVNGFVFEN